MKKQLFISLASAMLIIAFYSESRACNECHSKNPKMVRMHEALGFKDCFKCHNPVLWKSPEERKKQMYSDELCTPCHKK